MIRAKNSIFSSDDGPSVPHLTCGGGKVSRSLISEKLRNCDNLENYTEQLQKQDGLCWYCNRVNYTPQNCPDLTVNTLIKCLR